jgi:hypothetical protein
MRNVSLATSLTLSIAVALVGAGCAAPADNAPPPDEGGALQKYARKAGGTYQGGLADRTKGDLHAIASALSARHIDAGDYPQVFDLDALAAALQPAYIHLMPRTDAWGNPFTYRPTGDGFVLTSAGSDGAAGTDDDLTVSGENAP